QAERLDSRPETHGDEEEDREGEEGVRPGGLTLRQGEPAPPPCGTAGHRSSMLAARRPAVCRRALLELRAHARACQACARCGSGDRYSLWLNWSSSAWSSWA